MLKVLDSEVSQGGKATDIEKEETKFYFAKMTWLTLYKIQKNTYGKFQNNKTL